VCFPVWPTIVDGALKRVLFPGASCAQIRVSVWKSISHAGPRFPSSHGMGSREKNGSTASVLKKKMKNKRKMNYFSLNIRVLFRQKKAG
jgi:hypothetical protein